MAGERRFVRRFDGVRTITAAAAATATEPTHARHGRCTDAVVQFGRVRLLVANGGRRETWTVIANIKTKRRRWSCNAKKPATAIYNITYNISEKRTAAMPRKARYPPWSRLTPKTFDKARPTIARDENASEHSPCGRQGPPTRGLQMPAEWY